MVQTDRNEQTVEERIHARTDGTQFLDMLTEVHQTVEDNRPDVHHDERDNNHHKRGEDRHQSAAAEEGERFRQFNAAKAVIQLRGNDPYEDPHELVADFPDSPYETPLRLIKATLLLCNLVKFLTYLQSV